MLPTALCPVLFVGDADLGRVQQIHLIETLPLAEVYDLLFEKGHERIGGVVLIPGRKKTLFFLGERINRLLFSDAVDHDMNVDISRAIVTVRVGADDGLMPWEGALRELQPKGLRHLAAETVFLPVPGIKAHDIVVRLDLVRGGVLPEGGVCLHALHAEGFRAAEDAVHEEKVPQNERAIFVQDGLVRIFVMPVFQIAHGIGIPVVFDLYVFNRCHILFPLPGPDGRRKPAAYGASPAAPLRGSSS